jgi:hypothetical protein
MEGKVLHLEKRKEHNFLSILIPNNLIQKLDSKMLYDGSITEELVQNWIEELKEADVLDEDGKLIYLEF